MSAPVIVRAGDTLLIRVPDDSTPAEIEGVRAHLLRELPGVSVLALQGCDVQAVHRPAGVVE